MFRANIMGEYLTERAMELSWGYRGCRLFKKYEVKQEDQKLELFKNPELILKNPSLV